MKKMYRHAEIVFEKLVSAATAILGNSITFVFAFFLVIFWISNRQFHAEDVNKNIADVIHGIIFLSLFIIQKSFNHFSASLHFKINELVISHEPASNAVINAEKRTEHELTELSKEYAELAVQANEAEEEKNQGSFL